jgi:hypothetical protein
MALSKHEQDILITFAEEHFKDLPKKCIELFKEEPRLPGFGKVMSDDEIFTMKVSLSVSLVKSYEVIQNDNSEDLALQVADLFAQEYSMHMIELYVELLTNEEDMVNTSIPKLLKYCKMERDPIIITSPQTAGKFTSERGFVASDITSVEPELGYFYELGRIRNVSIVVDPLQSNPSFAYLITGNIIDYRMGHSTEETLITYELTEDGNDLIAIFKPVTMFYQTDLTGMNYKFFNII